MWPYRIVKLADGSEIACHALIIASGVQWRRLNAPGRSTGFKARACTMAGAPQKRSLVKAKRCISLAGRTRPARQPTNFAKFGDRVVKLVHGDAPSRTMSQYRIDQIPRTRNIQLWTHASVAEVHGDKHLEEVSVLRSDTNKIERVSANAMFIFIGAMPTTEWLADVIERDDH